jgi:hypothetical protein
VDFPRLSTTRIYQMVRLVFRPYTQVRKAICTSAHLRASTRVSSGFALLRHSSPSFGSQRVCSYSNLSQKLMVGRWCRHRPSHQSGYLRLWVFHPPTRIHVRLLGPCFKTGRLETFRQQLEAAVPEGQGQLSRLGQAGSIGRVSTPTVILPAQPLLTST